jgi:hypothetical protein
MKRILALSFIAAVLVPTGLLVSARPAHAQYSVVDVTNLVQNTITALATKLVSDSSVSLQIKEYILDPIAWALSNQMIQRIAGSVINFVNGQGNGTGAPQFVQDLNGFLQQVGDNQVLAFLAQFSSNSNSPFSASIVSALRTNYLQQSSLGGFFAANQCTLGNFVSGNDPTAFFSDWTQGGLPAWFALIQNNNDPFAQYQNAYSMRNSLVANAGSAQLNQLSWGQGFLSWCADDPNANAQPGQLGANPPVQTACLKSDGTSGVVQTPGSVILASVNKATGASLDKIISADELDELISQLAGALLDNVLGGSSGGLFGLSQSSGDNSRSFIDDYAYGDTGNSAAASANAVALADQMLANVAAYQGLWDGLATAAQNGITRLQSVAASCSAVSGTEQSIIDTKLRPALAQAQQASTAAANTKALALKIKAEASATDFASSVQIAQDAQQLSAMRPTQGDVILAQNSVDTLVNQVNAAVQQGESAATPTVCGTATTP